MSKRKREAKNRGSGDQVRATLAKLRPQELAEIFTVAARWFREHFRRSIPRAKVQGAIRGFRRTKWVPPWVHKYVKLEILAPA